MLRIGLESPHPPEPKYRRIVAHYEACLSRHGDSHLGVDWPNARDAALRYKIMFDLMHRDRPEASDPVRLLDFGCGAGHFLEYLRAHARREIVYHGVDLSEKFIALCREKFSDTRFDCIDILVADVDLPQFDYVIANGVFTENCGLGFDEMLEFVERVLTRLWPLAKRGLAFNVMSDQVDWRRDDLFHLPMDRLAAILSTSISRHFIMRADYGLYEYTTYVYRASTSGAKEE